MCTLEQKIPFQYSEQNQEELGQSPYQNELYEMALILWNKCGKERVCKR